MYRKKLCFLALFALLGSAACASDNSTQEEAPSPSAAVQPEAESPEESDESAEVEPTYPVWLLRCWETQTEFECWNGEKGKDEVMGAVFPSDPESDVIAMARYRLEPEGGELILTEKRPDSETKFRVVEQTDTTFVVRERGEDADRTIEWKLVDGRLQKTTTAGESSEVFVADETDGMSSKQFTRMVNAVNSSGWSRGPATDSDVRPDVEGVTVYSRPSKLSIYLDGQDSGQKTASTLELEAGDYEVAVVCPSGETSEPKSVALTSGNPQKILFRCNR